MNKNVKGYVLSTLLTVSVISFGIEWKSNSETANYEEEDGVGYFEQFYQMKQNEKGEMPGGLWKQWEAQTPKLHGKTGFFTEVNEIGPYNVGGRVISMVIDSEDANHLICGGATGGIWHSYDAGSSWEPLDDLAPNLAVSSITQNPFNPDIIYYATGGRPKQSGGLEYSGDGLFKSLDRGKTFEYIDSSDVPAFKNSWDIVCSLTDSNTIYIGTMGNGLFRSQDGGMTYELIHSTTGRDVYDVDVTAAGRVYFSVYADGIYWFDEAETPVIKKYNIPTGTFHRCVVEASKSQPNTIYAAFARYNVESTDEIEGVYKTTDGGNNWTKLRDPSLVNRNFDQNWFNFILAVHPTNPNFVLVAGVYASYSTNGGNSWSIVNGSRYQMQGHVDYHGHAFVPGTNTLYLLNDGGIYRYSTTTIGSLVLDRNSKLNITQVYSGSYFPTGTEVIIGNQDNRTQWNRTGSAIFQEQFGGDGAFTAVSPDGQLMYASSQYGNMRRWTGSGWTRTPYFQLTSATGSSDFWFINPFEMNPVDGDQVYFPTKNHIVRTTNTGNSWTRITNSIPGSVYSVAMTQEDNPTLYFGGSPGILYRIDNAKTASVGDEVRLFTKAPFQARGGFIGCIKVDPSEQSTIYTGYTDFEDNRIKIWKILNADTEEPEWVDISGNLPDLLPVNWIEVDPTNSENIMVGTDFGLYVTANGGRFWHKEERIPNVYISMLRLRPSDRKLFIFTHGRGVWTADLDNNIVVSTSDVNSEKAITVYPNPASDYIRVTGDWMNKTIYNAEGKVVWSGDDNQISTAELATGIYFLQARNEESGEVSVAKFTKR